MASRSLAHRLLTLAGRRYATARVANRVRLAVEHRDRATPIVVHQPGKVGSETVVASLAAAGFGGRVFHTHFLSAEGVRWAEGVYRASSRTGSSGGRDHLWESQHLRRRLGTATPDHPWQVVTLVRDPVARNLSSFFQIGQLQLGLDYPALLARLDDPDLVAELTDAFLHRFDEHDRPMRWFDDEVRDVFGVDVRDVHLDRSGGWARRRAGRADLLVLKVERLGEVGPRALGAFVGVDEVPLVERNVGEDKGYGPIYRRMLTEVTLPPEYVDRLYGDDVTRALYSDAELDAFRRRWLHGRSPAS